MDRIVECVPNFSEGRNQATVQALIDAVASVAGVRLLDYTMDYDHHRSVLTLVGEPEAMLEAVFRTIRVATDLIDLQKAPRRASPRGSHRCGAVRPDSRHDDAGLCAIG